MRGLNPIDPNPSGLKLTPVSTPPGNFYSCMVTAGALFFVRHRILGICPGLN
jgi:hypothetical protein